MSVIDIIVLVIMLFFAIIGFKRGVIQSLVSLIGFILVIYLAYLFKNYLGDIFVTDLPFFNIKIGSTSSTVMNIVMYQMLAFVIMMTVLGLVYKFLLYLSGIVEKIFKLTIVLGIPSKLLGIVVGLIEGYVFVYLFLFFVSQPYIKMDLLSDSTYAKTILTKTPVLSGFANNTLEVITEVNETVNNNETENFELNLSELILKHKVTSPEIMEKLSKAKKINVTGLDEVIDKYKNISE